MSKEYFVYQENANKPELSVIKMQSEQPLSVKNVKLPDSCNELVERLIQNEKLLINNIIEKEDNEKQELLRETIEQKLKNACPQDGIMLIYKGNLLIALNHDVVSFKLADLFTDEYKDTELVTFDQDKLTTMGESLQNQVINIGQFNDELEITS